MRGPYSAHWWRRCAIAGVLLLIGMSAVAVSARTSADSANTAKPEQSAPEQSAESPQSIFAGTVTPRVAAAADDQDVQLGVRFETAVPGDIVGIKFYKSAQDAGPYSGTLWDANGRPMAQVQFTATDGAGWKQAAVAPVSVLAGRQYVASYRAPAGHYAADPATLGRVER